MACDGTEVDPSALSIVDVPERRRFEARLGPAIVGFTQYDTRSGDFAVLHTEIDPAYEGKGFGSRLAAGVLDAARGSGLKIVVRCPFISAYIRRHPADYPDIDLDAGRTSSAASG
jgi:predicted GNAT family acetyltransferase